MRIVWFDSKEKYKFDLGVKGLIVKYMYIEFLLLTDHFQVTSMINCLLLQVVTYQ